MTPRRMARARADDVTADLTRERRRRSDGESAAAPPRTAAASPQPRRDDNKTTTDLPSRALGASRAKRRTRNPMSDVGVSRGPWGGGIVVPEKKTHIHTAVTCADEGRRRGGQSVASAMGDVSWWGSPRNHAVRRRYDVTKSGRPAVKKPAFVTS